MGQYVYVSIFYVGCISIEMKILLKQSVFRFMLYPMCAHHDKIQTQRGPKSYHCCVSHIGEGTCCSFFLWAWIGHVGPSFSDQTLAKQQQTLREQYHLPYKPIITDPKILQTPPERNLLSNTANTGS
jgi:hypothetical protein